MSRQKGNPVLFVIVHRYVPPPDSYILTYLKYAWFYVLKRRWLSKADSQWGHGVKFFMKLLSKLYNLTKYFQTFHWIQDWKKSHKMVKLWNLKVKIQIQIDFWPIVYFLQKPVFANYAPGALLRFFGLIKGGLQVFVLGP